MLPYILLFLGLLSVFIEFFLPGGIFAVIGVLLLLAGIAFSFIEDPSAIGAFSYFTTLFVGLYITIKFALYCVEHLFPQKGIFLKSDQEGFTASQWDHSLIGKEGIAFTDLRPGGQVQIEGKQYSAISKSGYLYKGEALRVVDGEGETLYVVGKES